MFIVTLTYTVPVDEVDQHVTAHQGWIAKQVEAGTLLVTGRRVPRTGGVLLAPSSLGRDRLDEVLATDPYGLAGVARYDVAEFTPSTLAPGFEALKGV